MTSLDVRDVLNLPQDGTAPRPTKKVKTSASRPNLKGLAREVQNLGGDNPIAIVPQVSVFKKRRLANRKPAAKWELKPFTNSARTDTNFVLRHWRRKTEADQPQDTPMENGEPEQVNGDLQKMDDSSFAKFNVQVVVPEYSEDQYSSNLHSAEWSKNETDYLMELVKDLDLRWPLIWDRYDYQLPVPEGDGVDGNSSAVALVPKSRTMEDLKARYYEVAAKMMAVQKPVQYMTHPEYSLHETMANFNANQEKLRKEFVTNSLTRSKEEAREEESLLLEVKRILARTERINEERRDLYARLDYPHTADQDISAFKSSAGLQGLLQNLMNVDKSKKRKSLIGADGISPASAGPGGQLPSAMAEGARRESIAASASGHRDSIGGDKTLEPPLKNNKKGGQQAERRKLTDQEEQVYGISHHERLTGGVIFRYEKVAKLFTQKSGQQQLRITNALNELDIPARLVMPTSAVASQFEQVVHSVTQLVDLRKIADKLDAEIKIEEQRKLERDRARGIVPQVDSAGEEAAKNSDTAEPSATEGALTASTTEEESATAAAQVETNAAAEEQATSAENPPISVTEADGEEPTTNGTAPSDAVEIKEEDTEKEKGARPSSSGAHKRSASVLSTTSDKSAKRQRK